MSKEYSPLVVAKKFTKQYYEMLHMKPQQLYRFYKEESNFFHGDGDEATQTIAGGESIREKVESLNLAGAKVDLTNGSLDAQRSDNNAVFLVVTGKFTMPGRCPRPFVQSFLLVSQAGKPGSQPSYYVRNSVFRLFGDDIAAPPKVVSETMSSQVTASVNVEKEEVQVTEPVKVESASEKKETEVSSEEDDKVEPPVANPPTEDIDVSTINSEPEYVNVSVKNDSTTVETPDEETIPKEVKEANKEPVVVKEKTKLASWACLFEGGSSGEPVQNDPKPKKMAPVKQKEPSTDNTSNSPNKTAGPPRTLYLRQLPNDVVEADVRELFEGYGTIKKIDVHAHKGFAFVDFADASSVKKAMQNSDNFVMRGTTIQIEERQTKGSGGAKNGNNNRGGKGTGGNNGGNRQNGQKGGDKKQGDNKGGNNNNNRNKTGNKAGGKQSNNAK